MAIVENIIYKIDVEGAESFKKSLDNAINSAIDLTNAVEKNNAKLATLDKGSLEYKKLSDEFEAAKISVDGLTASSDGMRKQLAQTKKQIEGVNITLEQLDKAGLKNTETYKYLKGALRDLEKQGGNLKDSISDLNIKLKNLGSDTHGIDAVIGGMQGIIATTEIAMGAQALFGNNSKALEETLIKLNGVMALANGIQQLQNVLQKESALSTYALGVAQSAYTAVVEASTIALGVFRAALMALGVGAVIAAIYGLYQAFKDFNFATIGVSEETKKFNTTIDASIVASNERSKSLDKEVEYLKAIGKTEADIALMRSANSKSQVSALMSKEEALKKVIADQQNTIKANESGFGGVTGIASNFFIKKSLSDNKALLEATKAQREEAFKQAVVDKVNYDNILNTKDKESNDKVKASKEAHYKWNADAQKKMLESLTFGEREYVDEALVIADELLAEQERLRKADLAEQKREQDERVEMAKIADELILQNQKDAEAKKAEFKKGAIAVINEAFKLTQDVVNGAFGLELDNIKTTTDAEIAALNKKRDAELASEDLSEANKVAITKKYQAQENQIKTKAWKDEQTAKKNQAIINGALAITNILATMPWVTFGISQGIAIASAAISTATQVALIGAQKPPKFKKGGAVANRGLIVGKPHEAGGKVIEVEGNEFVFKKEAVKHYGVNVLDQMNNMKLAIPKEGKGTQPINYDRFAEIIGDKLKENPMLRVSIDKKGINVHKGGYEQKNNFIDY